MSAKFKLVPNATFKHTVFIPMAGSEDAELEMTFKHKSTRGLADEQKAYAEKFDRVLKMKNAEKRDEEIVKIQIEFLRMFCAGWEVADEFSDENIATTMANYPRFFDSVCAQYQAELFAVRQKR